MFSQIHVRIRQSILLQRILWTLLVVAIYLAGQRLPIATAPLSNTLDLDNPTNNLLTQLSAVTGGEFSSLTLFSLGLSPWMTAMILWRFLLFFEKFKGMTSRQSQFYRLVLTLIIGAFQGLTLTGQMVLTPLEGFGLDGLLTSRLLSLAVLLAGAFVLMWLGEVNTEKGLGGPTVMILANMLMMVSKNIFQYFDRRFLSTGQIWQWIAGAVVISFVLIFLTIVTYRAEYRIQIRRINIISRFSEQTYIPIRLNPAGGMPFMYGMTLMMLPPVILQSVLEAFPGLKLVRYLAENLSLTKLPGIILYVIILYILTIAFSYFNYDPPEIAKGMRENGDYIEHIRPGYPTSQFINHHLLVLAHIGALMICSLGALPLLSILGRPHLMNMALMVNHIYIIASLLLTVIEQVNILQSWKKYGEVL